MIKNLQGCW